jgi:arabinose-5-phosphate isomerase
MSECILKMTEKRFGCVGVVDDDGWLSGVITDGDLRRHMGENLLARSVTEVMTATPRTIRPQALAAEALAVMNECSITSVFVVESREPVGILHIHDCLRVGVR